MKNFLLCSFLSVVLLSMSCGEDSESPDSAIYDLPSLSADNISGSLTITENEDHSATFFIQLEGTIRGFSYPTHLHYGNLSTENADIAYMLNPTSGDTGISETVVARLSDDTPITYDELLQGQYAVKIHLGDGDEEKLVILTAANIGAAASLSDTGSIAVCGSKKRGF